MIGFYSSVLKPLLTRVVKLRIQHKRTRNPWHRNIRSHVFELYRGERLMFVITERIDGPRWGNKKREYTVDNISHNVVCTRKVFTETDDLFIYLFYWMAQHD